MTDEADATSDAGIEVTRFVPIPTSVSPQAQQFLTLGLGMLSSGAPEEPAPDDREGWRALAASSNEMIGAVLGATTENLPLTVEATAVGDVPVFVVTPDGLPEGSDQPVFLDIHGGAFFVGFGDTCRVMAKHMAHQVQMRTWSVDYRTPPDHPYPAALNDCMTVYRRLLDDHPAERVVVGGGSAGGNLACALGAARPRRRPGLARCTRAVDPRGRSHRVR